MRARLPRLLPRDAQAILEQRGPLALGAPAHDFPSLETEKFSPTGPPRVHAEFLLSLRDRLMEIARTAGYPQRGEEGFRAFDGRAAVLLAELDLPLGEAIRSDTWAWVAVHLVPQLVEWRFGREGKPASFRRYAGALQRNAIGRLWYRAHVMREPNSADPWTTLRQVNEDAHVAVLERTSISRDHRLSRAIIRHWTGLGGGEQLLRVALIRVRIRAVMLVLPILSDEELNEVLAWAFQIAAISTSTESGASA